MKLGELLNEKNLVDKKQLKKALKTQYKMGGKLGDILLALTNMRGMDYYKTLAEHFKFDFVDLLAEESDLSLLIDDDREDYFSFMTIPIHHVDNVYTVVVADPNPDAFDRARDKWGENCKIKITTKLDVLWTLQKRFKHNYLDEAINDLIRNNVHYSSKRLFSSWQLVFLFLFTAAGIGVAVDNFSLFLLILNAWLTISLSGVLMYRLVLVLIGMSIRTNRAKDRKIWSEQEELPIYSILIPLYQEKEITLKNLFEHIKKLNYPKHKLDIKILVEEDDFDTISILKNMSLPRSYEYIYIPAGHPRTKSKACNYGLKFVMGEYVTLYDAEDVPDANQLKDSLELFLSHSEKLACVQCRLNFYNGNENWLTRMFTLEYSAWFDLMLPALHYTNSPIPLGGTSNHFRTSVLKKIDSWDPYNVTEDADLGMRMHFLGYKTAVIPSTTYEEANCRLINWIKQRTRWIKGYMQTYVVYMRNPFKSFRLLGLRGFLGFQLFLGGVVFSNLSYTIVWIIFLLCVLPLPFDLKFLFPPYLQKIAILNFMVGSVGMILVNVISAIKRRRFKLILAAFTSPIYWFFMSLASYRALFQLFFYPHYWDKTEHGISATIDSISTEIDALNKKNR